MIINTIFGPLTSQTAPLGKYAMKTSIFTDIAILHGKRHLGIDPCHTEEGRRQIASLAEAVRAFGPKQTAPGKARRFMEIDEMLRCMGCIGNVPRYQNIFCGRMDSKIDFGKQRRIVALPCGEGGRLVLREHFIDLSDCGPDEINIWNIINKKFRVHSLFCCGREFMDLLISQSNTPKTKRKSATLYGINRFKKTTRFLVRGTADPENDESYKKAMRRALELLCSEQKR